MSFFIRTFLHRFWPVYSRLVVWLRGWEWAVSVLLSGVVAAFIVVPAAIAIANLAGALVGTYDWLNMQVAGGPAGCSLSGSWGYSSARNHLSRSRPFYDQYHRPPTYDSVQKGIESHILQWDSRNAKADQRKIQKPFGDRSVDFDDI